MRLVVISSPSPIPGEIALINHMFELGLKYFHLRKPGSSREKVREILEAVPKEYRTQISLHQYHDLADEFGINRLHFPEAIRLATGIKKLQSLREQGILITTSIHDPGQLVCLPGLFEYVFFGPVFQSISKVGYGPKFPLPDFSKQEKGKSPVIGLGGVNSANAAVLKQNNFDGFALLGTIWEVEREESMENFKACISMGFTD